MMRVDPGDHFDNGGWGKLAMNADKADYSYMMWREPKNVFAEKAVDSGTGDNRNQRLSPPHGRQNAAIRGQTVTRDARG